MPTAKTKPAKKTKPKRRRKYCPVCEEEVSMTVMRVAESDDDLWWLLCPSCNGKFALTYTKYQKEKKPDMSASEEGNATKYKTNQTYSIGDLIYHPKLKDIGLVVKKISSPIANCSGAIIVSFVEVGQKTLIEGYKKG